MDDPATVCGSQSRVVSQTDGMQQTIVYVDQSRVREGRLEELKAAFTELATFVEENEPGILTYDVYFDDSESNVTVIHVHAGPDTLDQHFVVAGAQFAKFADMLEMKSIDVYGSPSEAVIERLSEKVQTLGAGTVTIHPMHAGFATKW